MLLCNYLFSNVANIIMDDAILGTRCTILFSRLNYEAIGTNGIIIQEMNVNHRVGRLCM